MPWRVESTAEAGVGWGMPGAAGLACASMCPPAEGTARGAGGEAWESHRAGTLRELFHVWLAGGYNSSAGGNPDPLEPRLGQCIMASHHCVAQRAADEGVGVPGCHGSAADTRIGSVFTCEEIFAEAQACTDADLYCHELRWTRPCCESC